MKIQMCVASMLLMQASAQTLSSVTILPPAGGAAVPQVQGLMADNMPAWASLAGSTFKDFPNRYTAAPFAYTVAENHALESGSSVEFTCVGAFGCNIVVFMYECSPCASNKGGLPTSLVVDEFVRSRCAPAFHLPSTTANARHHMTAFVKTVPAGTTTIALDAGVDFAMFGVSQTAATDCPSSAVCGDPVNLDFCNLKGGQCGLNTCIVAGPTQGGCSGPCATAVPLGSVTCANLAGGGWRLVRHVPENSHTFFPVNDNAAGSATPYGTKPADLEEAATTAPGWSVNYAGTFTQFLFATGNCKHYLITDKSQAIGSLYSNAKRTIIESSISSTPYQARWYNRATNPEDPWISIYDHWHAGRTTILYGEGRTLQDRPHGTYGRTNQGLNVWVR